MNHYLKSIAIHVAILLALLLAWQLVPSDPPEDDEITSVIVVDFSDSARPAPAAPSSPPAPAKQKPTPPPPAPKPQVKKLAPAPKPSIAAKNRQEEATIAAQKKKQAAEKLRQLQEAERRAEEARKAEEARLAEEKRQQEKAKKDAKRSQFKSLFDRSKKTKDAQSTGEGTDGKVSSPSSGGADNISGAIGSRSVVHIPRIIDHTQKRGRVVVKICVDASGRVITADYSQVGSTTTDAELIRLAEEGAKKYRFSKSDKARECGRVIIDFTLRA